MYDADFVGQGARNICTKEALVSELLASDDACTSTPRHSKTSSKRTVLIFHCEYSSERAPKLYVSVFICLLRIGHKSAPIQLAQCWFPGLAISSAKIFIYFSNKIYRSDFVEQHTETVMVWNNGNADCCLRKKILCQLWLFSAHFRPPPLFRHWSPHSAAAGLLLSGRLAGDVNMLHGRRSSAAAPQHVTLAQQERWAV